jgi:hypothetical protein
MRPYCSGDAFPGGRGRTASLCSIQPPDHRMHAQNHNSLNHEAESLAYKTKTISKDLAVNIKVVGKWTVKKE